MNHSRMTNTSQKEVGPKSPITSVSFETNTPPPIYPKGKVLALLRAPPVSQAPLCEVVFCGKEDFLVVAGTVSYLISSQPPLLLAPGHESWLTQTSHGSPVPPCHMQASPASLKMTHLVTRD